MRKQKRRGLLFGMLAISLAVITGFLFSSSIAALERKIGDMQTVVVAKTPIEPRTLITADMLEEREIPRMFAHQSYVQNIADIAGQRVAIVALEPEAILRQNDIAPTSGLDDGFRAVSIGVNPVAVQVDGVKPGSHVDIVVSYQYSRLDDQGKEEAVRQTTTVLQDVEVLTINGTPQPRAVPSENSDGTQSEAPEGGGGLGGLFAGGGTATVPNFGSTYGLRDTVVIATLKVSPEDVQKLAYVDTFASDIRLSLRRNDDRAVVPMKPITEEDFE